MLAFRLACSFSKANSPVHGTTRAQQNNEAGQGVVVTVVIVVEVIEVTVVAEDVETEDAVREDVVAGVVVKVLVVGKAMMSRGRLTGVGVTGVGISGSGCTSDPGKASFKVVAFAYDTEVGPSASPRFSNGCAITA